MKGKLEIIALVLGFIGLFGAVTTTALPTWKVSAFIGANLVVMEDLWEGLWMNCWRQENIKMQCKVYDSLLILAPELQAARGLMVVSIIIVFISLLITGSGIQQSNCCGDNTRGKNITLALGGIFFLLSCLITLIPVCWVGFTVINRFYNPLITDGQKRELGSALFIGWATSGVLLVTGILILVSYSQRASRDAEPYADAHLLALRESQKDSSIYLHRTPSSSHKHHQYV